MIRFTLVFLLCSFSLFAQQVDYDRIIPPNGNADTLSIADKLVFLAWKNQPMNEVLLSDLELAKSKKDNKIQIQLADAKIKAQKLQTRAEVLRRYQDYQTAIELQKHRVRSQEEAHMVHLGVARSFKKGEADIEAYNRSFYIYNTALEAKISAESNVFKTKVSIEELIGIMLEDVTAKKYEYTKVHKKGDTTVTASGLKYVTIQKGTGEHPKSGQSVSLYYSGKFFNGREFETNKNDEPFKFTLGVQQAIPGWDEGILLMRKGEKGVMLLPAKLAYGAIGIKDPSNAGQFMVPPNTPVMYEIELLDIQ